MFNQDSAIVKFWYGLVMDKDKEFDDIPNLDNLKEQVKIKLNENNFFK